MSRMIGSFGGVSGTLYGVPKLSGGRLHLRLKLLRNVSGFGRLSPELPTDHPMLSLTLHASTSIGARLTRSRFSLCLLLACLGAHGQPMLDLTAAPPEGAGVLGVPGGSFGGGPARPVARALPLDITIIDYWPVLLNPSSKIQMDMLVRNTSKKPVMIPSSKDYVHVIKPGNQDQRMLSVGVILSPKSGGKPMMHPLAIAVGSASVPGSMIGLAPDETLVIRVAGTLGIGLLLRGWTSGDASVRAALREAFMETDRFVVKEWSADVVSQRAVDLTVTK